MSGRPTAPIAAGGMISGYAVARYGPRRELGGAVLALAGAWCMRAWWRGNGPSVAVGLGAAYLAAFAAAHPLARRIGAWPSAVAASAATGAAAYLLADRRSSGVSSSPDDASA